MFHGVIEKKHWHSFFSEKRCSIKVKSVREEVATGKQRQTGKDDRTDN